MRTAQFRFPSTDEIKAAEIALDYHRKARELEQQIGA